MPNRETNETGRGSEPASKSSTGVSATIAASLAFVLAFVTYLLFYLLRMPLTRNETAFVACGWAGVVFLVRWGLGRVMESKNKKGVRRPRRVARKAKGGSLVLVVAFAVSRALAQAPDGVPCSAEYPEVAINGSVHLYAYLDSPNSSTDDTVWSVTAGKLKASPGAIVWDFLGVPAGIYQAEAKRRGNEGAPPICVVEVVALERTRTTEATLRSFLIRGDSEPDGYSLYSYLLLGSRPSESNRTKYIHAIEAVLQYSYTANELSSIFDPGQLNLTTIPVTGKPPADAAAKWVLDNYDFGRARAFLTKLGGSRLDGPYIVSATMPIMKSTPPYLFEDLSLVPEEPPQLVSWWVREFINQSSQRTQWNGAKLELFGLRIRTTIAILANAAPAVRDGFRKWVSVIK